MKLLRLLYKKLIWVASALWFFALFAVGWRVALENPLLVKLTVLGWHAPEVSFGVLVMGIFALGVALGLGAFIPGLMVVRHKLRRAQKKLAQANL